MPTGTKAAKEKKRRVVAVGVVAGAPARAIAAAAGCQKRHAQRIAKEPETQLLITEAMRPYNDKLRKLIPKALRAIERGMVAQIHLSGSDHRTQLLSARRLESYLKLAEGVPTETAGEGSLVTWEEFTVMYHRRVSEGATGQ